MATVTAIKQQAKLPDRYSVYIDGIYSFSLSATQLVESALVAGQNLSETELEEFKNTSQFGKAMMAAYRLLSYRGRSRHELKDRLSRKGYDEPTSESVLDRLSELKLVGDEDFTKNWLAQPKSKIRSRVRLSQELRQKGVDAQVIESQLSEVESDHEAKAIKQLIEKRLIKNDSPDRAKLINQLARQGFKFEVIKQVLAADFSEVHWR